MMLSLLILFYSFQRDQSGFGVIIPVFPFLMVFLPTLYDNIDASPVCLYQNVTDSHEYFSLNAFCLFISIE